MKMTVRIGDYVLYPAFFIAVFAVVIAIMAFLIIRNMIKERNGSKAADDSFRITQWQRKHVMRFYRNFSKDNGLENSWGRHDKALEDYILNSTYWNVDELLELDKDLVKESSMILFLVAQESFELKQMDDAVLLLHTIDMMNGGPDNIDFNDGEYPWIGPDVAELRNHEEMSDEEARLMHLYESALSDLYSFVDEDLEKIPEGLDLPTFCKRLSVHDMEDAAKDLYSCIDIHAFEPGTKDVITKAMFASVSIMMAGVFDEDDIEYLDEYRRYSIRALAAIIDGQLYSEVIDSIDE